VAKFKKLDGVFDLYKNGLPKGNDEETGPIWVEDPVSFSEFITSKEHMDFPQYSDRQMSVADFMIGDEPKKMFDNKNWLAVLCYGKGSGKDTISCHIDLYIIYVLLCLKRPHVLFRGIDDKATIDVVNIAYNARQANIVFFERFKTQVKHWKWLKSKYKLIISGKTYNPDSKVKDVENNGVVINSNSIIFPNLIRAFSLHSEQEGFEGLNPLCWILDEFSAFKDKTKAANAGKVLDSISTSCDTRFGKQGKGFVISYPRYKNDPTLQLIDKYKDDIHALTDIASTFEVKPKKCFCDKWVDYNGISIPEDYLEKFQKDPENSKCKYLCQPPEASDPFFTMPEKLDECVSNRIQLFEVEETTNKPPSGTKILISKKIKSSSVGITNFSFLITGDLGLSNDRTIISGWHEERLKIAGGLVEKHIWQDFQISWIPDKEKQKVVDVDSVPNIIIDMFRNHRFPIMGVTFDHWNSVSCIQKLNSAGINASVHKLSVQDDMNARAKIYSGYVHLLDIPEQTLELKRLITTSNGGADHQRLEHDDRWTTIKAAIKYYSEPNRANNNALLSDGGEIIGENMAMEDDGEIIGGQDFEGGCLRTSFF